MKTSRFSDSQIIAILKQAEGGSPGSQNSAGNTASARYILQMAQQVRWHGCLPDWLDSKNSKTRTDGSRRCMPKSASRQRLFRRPCKKSGEAMLADADGATNRRERRQHPTWPAWHFPFSQTCYRYQAKQSAENVEIADLLIRLTHNQSQLGIRVVLSVSA